MREATNTLSLTVPVPFFFLLSTTTHFFNTSSSSITHVVSIVAGAIVLVECVSGVEGVVLVVGVVLCVSGVEGVVECVSGVEGVVVECVNGVEWAVVLKGGREESREAMSLLITDSRGCT